MTSLTDNPSGTPPADPSPEVAQRPSLLTDEARQHADDRLDRLTVAAAQETARGRRSLQIILSIIALGAVAWLLLTRS
jgi:Pyruvate/2-oxoacid:ferredoxin oxidoreductase gamma subunit